VLSGYSASTIDKRRKILAAVQTVAGPLLEARAADIAAWRASLHVDADTVRTYVSHVRQFYVWAGLQGLRPDNPAARIPLPRRSERMARPMTEQHLLTALAAAPPRIRPWLVLAGWCGLRAKEIAYLRRECVLETAAVPVILVAHNATKGSRERLVPMSPFVLGELAEYGLPRSGWVFPRADGQSGPNKPHNVSHLMNTFLHEQGITETLHQARHRFATALHLDGLDIVEIKEALGHKYLSSTSIYVAHNPAQIAAAVERLPAPGRLRTVSQSDPARPRTGRQARKAVNQ
jgi:integrase/recombinase XerC